METKKSSTHKGEGHRKRLRDKFLESGLQGFHDYEVIELLLSLNTPRKDCKQSAKLLLKRFKTFQAVLAASHESLCEIQGVGPANSLGIRLIKEVADRYLEARIISKDVVQNPNDLMEYLNHTIGHKTKEVFAGIFLDAKNRVLTSKILFTGTLTTSSVYPREVIISALQHNAAAVIFAHNHPSGDVEPSESDIQITRKLFFALKYVGIILHEHIIIGNEGFYSFAAQGLISKFNKEFDEFK
ncbi:DNA repair protein RadC [Desulfobacula sp.]|uniref:RadC family protein n=1 Tax=Desulfobacula sp. TaxID=2593537 RepID=UPI0025BA96F2|nr:DNA repair protein RadC [Desulfobacula sp.]MBC2705934.1 DNA repair protein RadC [Desulfobacula sp.]MCK4768145.1 DNA repair protein RadC [Desulfobacula sp.]